MSRKYRSRSTLRPRIRSGHLLTGNGPRGLDDAVDAAIVVAIIALVGTIANAVVTLFGQRWLSDRQHRHEAEVVLARYRDPLASAAYDLRSRIYNILHKNFLRD